MGAPLPAEARAVTGLEQLQRQIAGVWSPPPIHYMTGLLVHAVQRGEATFTVPVTDWWHTESGLDWASLAVFAIDAPLGVAVLTSLEAGHATPTAELSISYVGVPAGADCVEAQAWLVAADGDTGVSHGEVRTDLGELVALATTRVFDVVLPHDRAGNNAQPGNSEVRTPVFRRPPPEHGRPPIDWLLGIDPVEQRDRMRFSVQVSGWVASPSGNAYGGYVAAVAQRAAVLASGGTGRPLDMKVNFFRPVPPRPMLLEGEAHMLRRGRRAGLAEVRLADPSGAPVAHAVSTLRLPEH